MERVSNSAHSRYFFLFIILLGLWVSHLGEQGGKKFINLPPVPRMEAFNPRIVRSQVIMGAFFGGFRGIVVDFLWIYVEHLWHKARFYELPPIYEMITTIQPEFINGWVMGGWHMAYNMSLELPQVVKLSPVIQRKKELQWVYRGLNFLKSGVALNPGEPKLLFEVGWTYFHRLNDYGEAAKWFERCSELDHSPDYVIRLVAHSLEKQGKLEIAYEKWLEIKKHRSYNDNPRAKRIVDRQIKRLEEVIEGKR